MKHTFKITYLKNFWKNTNSCFTDIEPNYLCWIPGSAMHVWLSINYFVSESQFPGLPAENDSSLIEWWGSKSHVQRDHHTKGSKSDREKQIWYVITYTWSLKKWYKWIYTQTEIDSPHRLWWNYQRSQKRWMECPFNKMSSVSTTHSKEC